MSGSVELEGSDGSWLILDVASGCIDGVEVAVVPLRNQGVYSRGDRGQLQRHPLDHGAEVKPPVAAG